MSDEKLERSIITAEVKTACAVIGAAFGGPPGAIVGTGVGSALDILINRSRLKGFDEARDEQIRFEINQALKALSGIVAGLELRVEQVAAAMFTPEETMVVVRQLYEQAMRAVLPERMRLICGAIAGVWRPDIDVEAKSRASRAVTLLEASDILELRSLIANHLDPNVDGKWALYKGRASSIEALLQAGCLSVPDVFGAEPTYQTEPQGRYRTGPVQLTDLGRTVLRFVETWKPRPTT